jgi:O-acetyl-ADP-ribose deacetylase (regulator of RNase III)/uncharacterized protein YwgA
MDIKIGNIFDSKASTLVNTINCVGVMGKGIALDFKKMYPEMYEEYVELCQNHKIKPGCPYYYTDFNGVSVINFPTKDHWRSPSRLSYIIDGLDWFRANYEKLGITSVAFPPLGCGNGGLSWELVGPVMYEKLSDLPIETEIYAPFGTNPEQLKESFLISHSGKASRQSIGVKQLSFNKYWLLILYVIQKLNDDQYSLSVGRTIFQKVCYILTRAGIPTGFHFVEGSYGPYSSEVKEAITVLSNSNLMTERQLGKMIETVVSPDFKFPYSQFTPEEMQKSDRAVDLLSRIKSTNHAEMVATVLFSYEELERESDKIKDIDIFNHVLQWKKRWVGKKEDEIARTIQNLSTLGWISPVPTAQFMANEDDLF